ncbi:MAG: terminase family protein [Alphaproteobacteria bacterium]|nr:terminase family protein [Alphaproteobacteria bacterium]
MNEKHKHLLSLLKQEQQTRHHEKEKYNWPTHARPNQLPPLDPWKVWLILAGRGFGKTRTGAETIRAWVKDGQYKRIALVGRSIAEARDIMIDGESGLMAVHPKSDRPIFEASKNRLVWPNGAVAMVVGGDHYERLRGPQFDLAWVDELAKFRYPDQLWEQLMLCLRLGQNPRCLITTTPKPITLLEKLLESPDVAITRGSTFDNKSNLAPSFLQQIVKQFDGTRLGSQELYAELLTDRPGALWQRQMIRYAHPDENQFQRIVIAIDPATTHHNQSDETGIVVAAMGQDQKVYILDDLSGRYSPADWGQRVAKAYFQYKADRVVAEINKGGDMVERIVRSIDPHIAYKAVRATRGKAVRAEPIAALYEQGKVFHARPLHALEKQLCEYIPGVTSKSPDRLDALVWAVTDLALERENNPVLKIWGCQSAGVG